MLNKSSTFSGTLLGFQETTKHDPETTKHVSSHQLLDPHDQSPSQPTKGTSERGKMYVFHKIREFSLSTIADLSVGVQLQVPPRPTEAREERRKLEA